MALLAEEIVEEWLRRDGYFTIRGLRAGFAEFDLLALKLDATGAPLCRHIEVNAAVNPANYLSPLDLETRTSQGRARSSAGRRADDALGRGVTEWIDKKFRNPKRVAMRNALCSAPWSEELVIDAMRHEMQELPLIVGAGIRVHRLRDIVKALVTENKLSRRACGADLVDLLKLAARGTAADPGPPV